HTYTWLGSRRSQSSYRTLSIILISSSFRFSVDIFFLLLLPPPGSTLFPYTTLFRSRPPGRRALYTAFIYRSARDQLCLCRRAGVDRKITRLNSSHLVISYAVFCLKKKSYERAGR